MGHDEGIVLTDRERETLAQLAASIGDPWLARQLTGQAAQSPLPLRRRRPSWLRIPHLKALSSWAGVVLVAGGAALALATFALSTAVASAGLVMMGVGAWRLVESRPVETWGESLAGWVANRRAGPRPERPAAQPHRPRKPPAAA